MSTGTLFGVGVGPGDPKLMTLRAVDTIAACPVIAAPRTPGGGTMALDIVRAVVDVSGKIVVPLDFAMSRDADKRAAAHRRAADELRTHLDAGRSVALANLGDITLYATFHYIADLLRADGYQVEMVPGVTSFAAAAARLGVGLAGMDTPIHIIPNSNGRGETPFDPSATTIWLKSGKNLRRLLERLEREGRLADTLLVKNCGLPGERVERGLARVDVGDDYFTVVILKGGEPGEGGA